MTAFVPAALILVGGLWIGQGLGFIPGSFMTSDRFWALAGAVTVASGVLLARRRRE